MAATIAVVYPHMNGLGGDGFWLVREPRGRVHALDACGLAGSLATIERYRDKGYDAMPPRGPDAAFTVAGAVSGWGLALDLAAAFGGQLPLDMLLGDAIRHRPRRLCGLRGRRRSALPRKRRACRSRLCRYLPERGQSSRRQMRSAAQPKLAETLDRSSHAGLGDFYRGDVGREIAADLERIGSPVTRQDLETHEARLVQPLSVGSGGRPSTTCRRRARGSHP